MIGTSIMKELTNLYNKFTESEVKKVNKFSCSRNFDFICIHFNIYVCLKWLEKPTWLINTWWYYRYVQKCRSRSPKMICKKSILDSFAKFTRNHLCRSLLWKILLADWKQTPTQVFLCEFWQVIKNTYFEDLLQVNNDSEQYNNLFQ